MSSLVKWIHTTFINKLVHTVHTNTHRAHSQTSGTDDFRYVPIIYLHDLYSDVCHSLVEIWFINIHANNESESIYTKILYENESNES